MSALFSLSRRYSPLLSVIKRPNEVPVSEVFLLGERLRNRRCANGKPLQPLSQPVSGASTARAKRVTRTSSGRKYFCRMTRDELDIHPNKVPRLSRYRTRPNNRATIERVAVSVWQPRPRPRPVWLNGNPATALQPGLEHHRSSEAAMRRRRRFFLSFADCGLPESIL